MSELVIRNMEESDLDQIMRVQEDCYTEVEPESRSSLQSKIQLSADTCWVAEVNGEISAYLICHPWIAGSIPPLDAQISALPDNTNLFYFHDLAVSPRGQGQGLGRSLVGEALSFAKSTKFERAALIAVQESSSFWGKFGFVPSSSLTAENARKLSAYGNTATYMENLTLKGV